MATIQEIQRERSLAEIIAERDALIVALYQENEQLKRELKEMKEKNKADEG